MNGIEKIIFGTMTFSLGAVSGYFVSKKMLNKQYREDVADVQAFYREKLEELGVMEEGYSPEENVPDEDAENPEAEAQRIDALNTYRGQRRYITDYTKPSLMDMGRKIHENASVVVGSNGEDKLGAIDPDDETPPDDPEYEAELDQMAEIYARRRAENMKNGEPYLIEPEEYHEGPEEYDRQALYYYSEDRVLCEDDDRKVEDEEECVGFDYEDKLDMQTTCWVRNDRLRVLYEIHRIDESYTKAVLGVSETPREREFRIQGRRKKALDDR